MDDRSRRAPLKAAISNQGVLDLYARVASVYDHLFGYPLQAGRRAAVERLSIQPGDAILEVGVGTAFDAPLYPRDCSVTGIDLSASMLVQATRRLTRLGIRHIRLARMDAAHLSFHDEAFDIVYAPYVMTVVPDPLAVVREMRRVCRIGGRVVLLNHFLSRHRLVARIEQAAAPMLAHVGFRPNLDLGTILDGSGLEAVTVEPVNWAALSLLVTCCRVS